MATVSRPGITLKRRVRPRIGPRCAGIRMTAEEFDRLPPGRWIEGYRYELVRGVLIVCPPPSNLEISPNELLGHLLWLHHQTHPEGSRIDECLPEQTLETGENRRRADRAIWVGLGRLPDPAVDFPAIAIEFLSPSKSAFIRDHVEKRDEYLGAGAREYWVFDRFRRTMTVYRTSEDGMLVELSVRSGETYRTDLLPGFELPLDRLLAKADDWSRPKPDPRAARPRPNEGGTP